MFVVFFVNLSHEFCCEFKQHTNNNPTLNGAPVTKADAPFFCQVYVNTGVLEAGEPVVLPLHLPQPGAGPVLLRPGAGHARGRHCGRGNAG